MASVIRGSDNFDTALITSVAIIADVKANTATGGSNIAGRQTRDLNTELSDENNIVTLSSNEFTLQAGKYLIEWRCPAYQVDRHDSRLYNVTDAAVEAEGSSMYADYGGQVSNNTTGIAIVTIASSKAFRIEHFTQTVLAGYGLGVDSNASSGQNSVFTTVKISKIGL